MRINFNWISAFLIMSGLSLYAAKTPVFTTYKVPKEAGFARLSDVAVSPDGLVMAVWEQGADGTLNRVRYSILDPKTGAWTPSRDIPDLNVIGIPGISRHEWPRVCSGGDGEFFVTWGLRRNPRTHDEHTWDTPFAHYTGGLNNGSFKTVEVIAFGDGGFPTISYNAKTNTPSVYWEHTQWFPWIDIDQMVSHRVNNQWTVPESMATQEGIYAMAGGRIEVAVPDENGNLYAVWEQKTQLAEGGFDREIVEIAFNYTRNGKWISQPMQLTRNNYWTIQPNIAVSPDGTEAYVIWFNFAGYSYSGQHITFSGENQETVTRGSIVGITPGHADHKWYDTGLVYHGDRFYLAFIHNRVVRVKTFSNNEWSEDTPLQMIGEKAPRYVKMGSSPLAGLAVSWQTNSVASTEDVYVAYAPFPVSGIHPVAWAQQINVREKSLFFENNYNSIRWVNSEDNIVDEVNKASRFLVFRIEQGQEFNFDATPYQDFNSATPSAGFEIIQSNRTYRFIEKLSQANSRKLYQYAIVAVDENDNRSEAVIAEIEN